MILMVLATMLLAAYHDKQSCMHIWQIALVIALTIVYLGLHCSDYGSHSAEGLFTGVYLPN